MAQDAMQLQYTHRRLVKYAPLIEFGGCGSFDYE